jgi:phage/plasmid primase-like uncharacterized protein
MSITDDINKTRTEEEEYLKQQESKCGNYVSGECPECGRRRLILGKDGKRRCEKCCWCVEDKAYDMEFSRYI